MSNSSPIPVPTAVTIAWISSFESTLLIRFFSALMTFPRSGRIAWYVRSRASTGRPAGRVSLDEEQLRHLGIVDLAVGELAGQRVAPSGLLRRVRSRAFRAAGGPARPGSPSRRCVAPRSGSPRGIRRASGSPSSRRGSRSAGLPSFVFVCPSNCGFRSFTEMTAARPSRTSSPSRLSSFSLSRPWSRAYLLSVPVSAERKPGDGSRPRVVLMLFANVKTDSDVGGVPLHRDLDGAVAGLALEEDDCLCSGSLPR